ncbi:MAG TPA: ATP-binding protein [Alphaproteobacteria bacterium]|nr:ATP-binding protein [Alphaproteobacteria bacterium]
MDAVRNPFAPGAGTPPPELTGRDEILEKARVTLARIRLRRSAKSLLLVGLRGVGKTVLLNRIWQVAEHEGYLAELIEVPEHRNVAELLVPSLRRILLRLDDFKNVSDKVKRAIRTLKSFVGVVKVTYRDIEIGLDIDPERGVADSGDIEHDLQDLFVSVGEAALARDTAVAIIIDELQYLQEKELSALIMAMHRVAQNQLPLVVIGAGLPQLVAMSGESKSYAERLFEFPEVGPLRNDDAIRALAEPAQREGVRFERDALAEILKVTQGYPYFLQEWGYHAWNQADASPITLPVIRRTTKIATAHLDESFFRVRFDRLTPAEKRYLRAMAELGPGQHRSGAVADILGVKVNQVGPVRSALIRKGMVYSPQHGDTAFTVPLFDQFMRRAMAEIPRH